MKNILVLGADGMLGSAVEFFFSTKKDFRLFCSSRNNQPKKNKIVFDALKNKVEELNSSFKVDYIINCIGIIKPLIAKDIYNAIYINSLFPIDLANYCFENNIKLIHITTDCVFSGQKGFYDEDDYHDALDVYGKSKSLGEPNNSMVLRTSIIGKEINNNSKSLISWIVSQKNGEINGFENHYWNGVTTNYLAEIIYQIIIKNIYKCGIFHIHSPNFVSKYELLKLINDTFKLNIKINKINEETLIDRRLNSIHDLSKKLVIKTIQNQIQELI